MWRAVFEALPTCVNLMKQKVLTDRTCQLCGLDLESTFHALWSYPKLNAVWALHFGPLRDDANECSTFQDLFQVFLEKGHPTDLLAMVSSHVWLKRNKLKLGEMVADLRLLNSSVSEALLEFQQANNTGSSPPLPIVKSSGSLPLQIGSKLILTVPFFKRVVKLV